MPSFDVVSEVDHQEVRNAVDQAQRELATRFDFKNTNSVDRAERPRDHDPHGQRGSRSRRSARCSRRSFVKRGVSLKGIDWGKVEEATQNTVRQVVTIKVGISSRQGTRDQQDDQGEGRQGRHQPDPGRAVRVTGKKRDDLQGVIAALKAADLGIPLQFKNFRD